VDENRKRSRWLASLQNNDSERRRVEHLIERWSDDRRGNALIVRRMMLERVPPLTFAAITVRRTYSALRSIP
jgi:hypothetical protein